MARRRQSLFWEGAAWIRRWGYRLEKGRPHVVGLMAVLALLVPLALISALILMVAGQERSFWDAVWWSVLHLSDPGYLGSDEGVVGRTLGGFMTLASLVFVTTFFIAFATSLVSHGVDRLRDGFLDVAFDGHTVILGWNGKVFALVEELFLADADVQVAILGDVPKEAADEEMQKRVFDAIRGRRGLGRRMRFWRDKRRQVVYRQGNPLLERDLQRVGVRRAQHVIILAPEQGQGLATDIATLRVHLAVQQARQRDGAGGPSADRLEVVSEITDDQFRTHSFMAAQVDPRADAWVQRKLERDTELERCLPALPVSEDHDDLTLVNGDELVSRVLVQCAVQPRLSRVYDELLSFEGHEFYLLEQGWMRDLPAEQRGRWEDLVRSAREIEDPDGEGRVAVHFARHVQRGIVVGLLEAQEKGRHKVHFDLSACCEHLGEWPLLCLGPGARRGAGEESTVATVRRHGLSMPAVDGEGDRASEHDRPLYNVLILGHNRRVPVLIHQFADYTAQYGRELRLNLAFAAPELPRAQLKARAAEVREELSEEHLHLVEGDFLDWPVLTRLLRGQGEDGERLLGEGASWDAILLLAEDFQIDDQRLDARVLLGLVMLRAIRSDPTMKDLLRGASVVAEILDRRNRDIIEDARWITDVIISNQYVSRFIAQVSIDSRVEDVYRELFDFADREIYARDLEHYAPPGEDVVGRTFLAVFTAAARRGEIAIGYTRDPRADDFQERPFVLAPDADWPLDQPEKILVIAEK